MTEPCPRCGEYVECDNPESDYGRHVKCASCGLEGDAGIVWEPFDIGDKT